MDTIAIVLEIDNEISRLQQVKQLLTAVKATEKRKPGRPSATNLPKKTGRKLSAASRENIAAAQKKRWAKVRRAKKAALNTASSPSAKKPTASSTAKKSASSKKSVFTKSAKKIASVKKAAPAQPKSSPTPEL